MRRFWQVLTAGAAGLLLFGGRVVLDILSQRAATSSADFAALLESNQATLAIAVVVFGLWGIYWFGLDRRVKEHEAREARWKAGFEREIRRAFLNETPGLNKTDAKHEPAPDHKRRPVYERAGLERFYEPTATEGVKNFRGKIQEGWTLAGRIEREGLTDELKASGVEWEDHAQNAIADYASLLGGITAMVLRSDAKQFGRPSFTTKPTPDEQLNALGYEIRTLGRIEGRLLKRADKDAEWLVG